MTKNLSKMSLKKKDSSKKTPRVLANRYEIVKKLGKGNFGTAYLCKDLRSKIPETDEYDLYVLSVYQQGQEILINIYISIICLLSCAKLFETISCWLIQVCI